MVFTDPGISLKCQFNGADEVTIPVDKNGGNYGYTGLKLLGSLHAR